VPELIDSAKDVDDGQEIGKKAGPVKPAVAWPDGKEGVIARITPETARQTTPTICS